MKAGLSHKALFAVVTLASILFTAGSSGAQDGKQTPDDKKTWKVILPFDRRFCAGSGMTETDLPFGTAPGSGGRKVLKTEKTSKGTKETYTDGTWIEWAIGPDGSVIHWQSQGGSLENQPSSTTERKQPCPEGLPDRVHKTDTDAVGTPRRRDAEPAQKAEEKKPGFSFPFPFGFEFGGRKEEGRDRKESIGPWGPSRFLGDRPNQ